MTYDGKTYELLALMVCTACNPSAIRLLGNTLGSNDKLKNSRGKQAAGRIFVKYRYPTCSFFLILLYSS